MLEITSINIYVVENHEELHRVQNPFLRVTDDQHFFDGSGFYERQMPLYVELNRGQMLGGCPGGGGMITLGMD